MTVLARIPAAAFTAVVLVVALAACGEEPTGPVERTVLVRGSYTGLWIITAQDLKTNRITGCLDFGVLEIPRQFGPRFAGRFGMGAATGCVADNIQGSLSNGRVELDGTLQFALNATQVAGEIIEQEDLLRLLSSPCEVISIEPIGGFLDGHRLLASTHAELECANGPVRLGLVIDLAR